MHTLTGHQNRVYSATFSADSTQVSDTFLSYCFGLGQSRLLVTACVLLTNITCVVVKVITGSMDRTIRIWDVQSGYYLLNFAFHRGSFFFAFHNYCYIFDFQNLIIIIINLHFVKKT